MVSLNLCKSSWTPDIDLFASRVSHQVPASVSWKLDPYSKGRDDFQMCWTHTKGYAFSPFSLIGRALHRVLIDQGTLILITPAWQTQSWYPQLLWLLIRNPLILPKDPDLLQDPNKELDPLISKGNLQLLAWIVSGKSYLQKEYQRNLPLLPQMRDEQAQSLITNRTGISGIADVLGDKLTPLNALWLTSSIF